MNDVLLRAFFEQWIAPLAFAIALWWIIAKLKEIDRNGQRRDNIAKLTEIRVEGIAHALSNAPAPIGQHFKTEYEKKVQELLVAEKFIDSNGKS